MECLYHTAQYGITAGGKILATFEWLPGAADIIPFDEIKAQFGLNDSEFLQYLQLISIFKKLTSKGIVLGSASILDGKRRKAATG